MHSDIAKLDKMPTFHRNKRDGAAAIRLKSTKLWQGLAIHDVEDPPLPAPPPPPPHHHHHHHHHH